MYPKLRVLFAVMAGILLGGIIIALGEWLSPHNPPPGLNVNDPARLGEWISTLPDSAFLLLLLAYFTGSAAGGYLANWISRPARYRPALLVGFGLFVAGVINLVSIPHPLWFSIASALIYFAGAWIGGRAVVRQKL